MAALLAYLLRNPRLLVEIAGCVVVGLLLLTISAEKADYRRLETTYAVAKSKWAEKEAERERLARQATEVNAATERAHAAREQEIIREHSLELDRARAAADDARRDADELRADVERFTAAGDRGPAADAASCRSLTDRSATLGRLLVRADRLAERLAGAAEKHAGEARLLKHQIETDRAACVGKGVSNGAAQ